MADLCGISQSTPAKDVSDSEPRAATLGNLAFASAGQNESVSDSVSDHPQWPEGLKGPEGLETWKAA